MLASWKCDYLVGVHSGQRSMSRKNMKGILDNFQSGKVIVGFSFTDTLCFGHSYYSMRVVAPITWEFFFPYQEVSLPEVSSSSSNPPGCWMCFRLVCSNMVAIWVCPSLIVCIGQSFADDQWFPYFIYGDKGNTAHSALGNGSIGPSWLLVPDLVNCQLNLLVATKVGEEGLDIQTCCLVIRFDPPETVSSFIQSRGRARMPQSEYAFLVDRCFPIAFSFWCTVALMLVFFWKRILTL